MNNTAWKMLIHRLFLLTGLLLPGLTAMSSAQEPEVAGRFISVGQSVSSEVVSRIRKLTDIELKRFKDIQAQDPGKNRTFKLIFDFTPDGTPNDSQDFGVCLNLAEVIQDLDRGGAEVTGFVHGKVTGHAVLPVMTCRTLVMSSDAVIGPITSPEKINEVAQDKIDAYLRLAAHRPRALIRKLFEKNLVVVPSRNNSVVPEGDANAVPDAAPIFGPGSVASFTFQKAKSLSLCEQDARSNRRELAQAYRLPRASLYPLLSQDRVVAWRVPVEGIVDAEMKERLNRRIRRAIAKKANLIVLDLSCGGGEPAVAFDIANEIREYDDKIAEQPLMMVAYYGPDARDTALYLALGCDYIVAHPEAKIGGFGKLLTNVPPAERKQLGEAIKALASDQLYAPVLVQAFVDNTQGMETIYSVTSAKGQHRKTVITGRQLNDERDQWNNVIEIPRDPDTGFLTLQPEQARRLGLVQEVHSDVSQVFTDLGIDAEKVGTIGSDWLENLAEYLRSPWASFLLVMVGITCLILELKMPGVGLPGVLAALCFVVFFWSHSDSMNNQITWLAILLFVLGVILLFMEIFVLPGFGVCGLSGLILTIGSLGLMAYGHWPQSGKEWIGFSQKLTPYGVSLFGAITLAILLARYLPSIPWMKGLMLKPQTEDEFGIESQIDPAQERLASLLGAIGVAATTLRPAGKVQFGEEFVDVVAEGSYIVPGTKVQVIEVEGNRVVVKEL